MTSKDLMNEAELVISRGNLLQRILEEDKVLNNIIGNAKLEAKIEILEELLAEFKEEEKYTNMHHAIVTVQTNLNVLNKVKGGCDA